MPAQCPACGGKLEPQFRFCGYCGKQISSDANDDLLAHKRQQETILFCDIVGSTGLSSVLDPEEYQEFHDRYHRLCTSVIENHNGMVAQRPGDGILAVFGYPSIHEDDALRAIAAGLDIIKAIDSWNRVGISQNLSQIQIRVAISTGIVVVRPQEEAIISGMAPVIGEAVNIAAKLQQYAEAGSLVISGSTYRLIEGKVDVRYLGEINISGVVMPVKMFKIAQESLPQNFFTQHDTKNAAPYVNRDQELANFTGWLQSVATTQGLVITISGEPGIGKTRFLAEALTRAQISSSQYQTLYCSSWWMHSAYAPIIQMLAANFNANAEYSEQLTAPAMSDWFVNNGIPELNESVSKLMLQQNPAAQQSNTTTKALGGKRWLVAELAKWILAWPQRSPIVLIIEDLHWADPSTLELIDEIVEGVGHTNLCLIITYRDGFVPSRRILDSAHSIRLKRFKPNDSERLARLTGSLIQMPAGLVTRIVNTAEGVPLFIEELTRMLLSHDYSEAMSKRPFAAEIPDRLRELLDARISRLGPERHSLHIAAAIGRKFSADILRRVSSHTSEVIDEHLAVLEDNGLLQRVYTDNVENYEFRHALIHGAAYDSILFRHRKVIHAAIAEVMIEQADSALDTHPELLAYHLSIGELPIEAARYWLIAGQRASTLSANHEAIQHFQSALKELQSVPYSKETASLELDLLIALGAPLLALNGWSAPLVVQNYTRALSLCGDLFTSEKAFIVNRCLYNVYLLRGDMKRSRELANYLLEVALTHDDTAAKLEAYRTLGMVCLFSGEHEIAAEHLARSNRLYDREKHHRHAFIYGSDPGVVGYSIEAWNERFRGNIDQALSLSQKALKLANDVGHPFSLAYAYALAGSLAQSLDDAGKALSYADKAIKLASEYDYPYWQAWGSITHGWALAMLGEVDSGITELQQGIDAYKNTGASQILSLSLALLAQCHIQQQNWQTAIALIVEAEQIAQQQGIKCFGPNITALKNGIKPHLESLQ